MPCQILWQSMTLRCVVTDDYGHFSYCCFSKVGSSNQNVHASELNLVLLRAFRSDEFKIVTVKWTYSGPYYTYILHVISAEWHIAIKEEEYCQ